MIKQSYWRLEKVYFTVSPVNDFFNKYKEWFVNEDGSFPDSAAEFAEKINTNDFIQVYKFPQKRTDIEHDYFEMSDDNHVIPRHLFELVD